LDHLVLVDFYTAGDLKAVFLDKMAPQGRVLVESFVAATVLVPAELLPRHDLGLAAL
jgi:hypothetical protein